MIMNIGKLISNNLYGGTEELSKAQNIYFKVFEFFVLYNVIYLAWYWGLYTLKITDVVLPLGIATMIDISFMHGNNLPLINAGLITLVMIAAFLEKDQTGSTCLYSFFCIFNMLLDSLLVKYP